MNELQDSSSLEKARDYIYSFDLSSVLDKMVKQYGWTKKEASKACEYYRNFLFLIKKYGDEVGTFPPSLEIDEIWHTHILDTQKYIHDCERIFGYYLHHDPNITLDKKMNLEMIERAYDSLQELHLREFGFYIYNIMPGKLRVLLRSVVRIPKRILMQHNGVSVIS